MPLRSPLMSMLVWLAEPEMRQPARPALSTPIIEGEFVEVHVAGLRNRSFHGDHAVSAPRASRGIDGRDTRQSEIAWAGLGPLWRRDAERETSQCDGPASRWSRAIHAHRSRSLAAARRTLLSAQRRISLIGVRAASEGIRDQSLGVDASATVTSRSRG